MNNSLDEVDKRITNRIKNMFNSCSKLVKVTIVIILLAIIIGIILLATYFIILQKEKHMDISYAIHGVITKGQTEMRGFFGSRFILDEGENVYILEKQVSKNNMTYYKVKWNDRVGKIVADNVNYFVFDNTNPYALMSDVSQFNFDNQFRTIGEFEVFLLNNGINYVYIRAGGRGYGEAGNFYTDSNYQMYVDACEYLGIPYGFYYLDEALNEEEIKEEVAFVKKFIEDNSTSMNKLPIAIDIEYQEGEGRADNIWNDRAYLVNQLIKAFKEENIDTIVYANYKRAKEYLTNVDSLLWVAYYKEDDKIPDQWNIEAEEDQTLDFFKKKIVGWQFSETGAKKSGIDTIIDLSLVKNDTHYFSTVNILN